jgi:hypothetical protein
LEENFMQLEAPALASIFSEWERATDAYLAGMEALRRREPGASARLMHLAREMNQGQARLTSTGFCGGTMDVLSLPARATIENKPQPEARSRAWVATAWNVLVKPRHFGSRRQLAP